jgi:hypothetical protein
MKNFMRCQGFLRKSQRALSAEAQARVDKFDVAVLNSLEVNLGNGNIFATIMKEVSYK